MALILPYPDLDAYSTGVQASAPIEANFAAVAAKFGDIRNADVAANAGISIDKLDKQYQEVWVELFVNSNMLAAAWPAAGATTPLALVPIPGSNGDEAWTITDVSWVCNDCGGLAGLFDVRYGAYNAGTGLWANAGSIVTNVAITAGAANTGGQGKALEGGSTSIAFSATAQSIALMSAGADATMLTGAGTFFVATVCLRRKIKGAT